MRRPDMGRFFLRRMLRKARNSAGLSQRDLGDAIGRSDDTIRGWELGKTDVPHSCIDALAEATGMSSELRGYMKKVARARHKGEPIPIEADMRFNAMYLSLGEAHYGDIFKWDSVLIPGPLQTQGFHFSVVRKSELISSDDYFEGGWRFKTERRRVLEDRQDQLKIQFLIGEAAFQLLKREPEEIQHEQLDFLDVCDRRPGWEIKVLTDPWASRQGNFEIYGEGSSSSAGPPFVYTEIHDSSWLIPNPSRIAKYDEFRQKRWPRAIRYEEYRNDY